VLNTNEVRARAAKFSNDWKDAHYEKGETQSFYNDFFEVFGLKRRQVAAYEEPVKRLGNKRGFLDLFWKGVLLVEQKSAGRSLAKAKEQAFDYFPALKPDDLPRYLLVSDFQTFELYDLDEGAEHKFALRDLAKHVEKFNFIRGLERRVFKDQDPVNIKASELMGELHDALKLAGYTGHDLEQFLVRLVFCLFADDTGIFDPRDIFLELLVNGTREDGSDTGPRLAQLFEVLNTPDATRERNLPDDLDQFPYVNGDLFKERLKMPSFDSKMRKLLIKACEFKWDAISPAIFGALFQSIMDKAERRKKGAHYTTELNILKVIQPLFLDRLRAQFEEIKLRRGTDRKNKLRAFHDRLADLTFLDPACGCGNFLIITYRELRKLELELLLELHPRDPGLQIRQAVLDLEGLSRIDVNQFYGIELEEFSARIAETALWMMDHILNNELSLAFGRPYIRIPLKKAPAIRHADALEFDWKTLLSPEKCSYVLGNPPFGGAKFQSEEQRAQVRRIANLGGSGGTLDFVAAWFLKAGEYVQGGDADIGFVATNSITQGEQVAQLWPLLFGRYGLEIAFAHRTFAWGSDARGKAHVHVVILGLAKRAMVPVEKRLFNYDDINGAPVESRHKVLSPYLFDASGLRDSHIVVSEKSTPYADVPKLIIGTKPIDGGHYILDDTERDSFLVLCPNADPYIRPFIGGHEFLNGVSRWLLVVQLIPPTELSAMKPVLDRIASVREYRKASPSAPTRKMADTPTEFHVTVIPASPFLAIPEVSSERREYLPIAWLEPPTIPSNKIKLMEHAELYHFGVLTSRMHMAWLHFIGGRLKSDFQYSSGIVYNTFPWPTKDDTTPSKISLLAQAVLDARARYSDASLADLYDANAMKPELRKAHQNLDKAIDTLYRRTPFASDRERVEHLFMLYEKISAPFTAAVGRSKRKSKP